MVDVGLKAMLDGIAIKLIVLVVMMFLAAGVVRFLLKRLPIFKELKQYIIGIAALFRGYLWYKVYFIQ